MSVYDANDAGNVYSMKHGTAAVVLMAVNMTLPQ